MTRAPDAAPTLSRRQFLHLAAGAGSLAVLAVHPSRLEAVGECPDPFAGGRFLGTLPLFGAGGGDIPLGRQIGDGLDARMFTDLSELTPETLITPSDRFFVRTSRPVGLDPDAPWSIAVRGLVTREHRLELADVRRRTEPLGVYLNECAGNSDPRNYGLMSAAHWSGVRLRALLPDLGPAPEAKRILISGFDEHTQPSRRSTPGASWIFGLDEIDSSGAFLATEMNGAPLSGDHGFPVRLVVPRWYGCAWIKWVNEIRFLDDETPATAQMKEFAGRTHQTGRPELARDYEPAVIDQAAMPVRIEKWLVDGRLQYKIVGIMWGGERPTGALRMRFNPGGPYVPIEVCPPQTTNDTWTLWSHAWRPARSGRYTLVLDVDDPAIRTRRLDLFFYARQVDVDEV